MDDNPPDCAHFLKYKQANKQTNIKHRKNSDSDPDKDVYKFTVKIGLVCVVMITKEI